MRNRGIFMVLSLFIFILYSCALPPDDEEEGIGGQDDPTSELPWSGDTDKFIINKEGIRLNDLQEAAGSACLTIPSTNIKNTRWEFGVRLTFNPSANNYARFYLTSSSKILSGILDGYFIQIGGAKDNVALYRQNGSQPKLLISGRELMKGNNSPKLFIKVECDNNGYWTFWTRLESEAEYIKEQQVKDFFIDSSAHCGIYCVYTKSRSTGFTFHHIQLTNDVETNTEPEENPNNPDGPDDPINPILPDYPTEVRNMLLFNEVMYDNATNGTEYIELYNPSDTPISIPSLQLLRYVADENGSTHTTTTAILQHPNNSERLNVPPYGYICFTKSATTLMNKHKVDKAIIIEVATLPKINNEGGYLAIVTNEEKWRLIDKCSYSDKMHTDKKRKQGVSLEKKSPEIVSSLDANWRSSKDATGGTPGRKNSE